MKSEKTTPGKVAKETVVDEHRDGSPHITIGDGGIHHYMRGGCSPNVKVHVVVGAPSPTARAPISGPAKVTTDSYRAGWDAIDWGAKGGDA